MARRRSKKGQGTILGEKTIFVDGLEITLLRKAVKNSTLRVKDPGGEVVVSAPPYVPQSEIEDFVRRKRSWIDARLASLESSPLRIAAQATEADKQLWKELVSACVPALIEVWEPIIGVKALRLAYRNMTSRWGSCQPSTGRICINTRLALYPPECLEYVVVHELCHLREANHGPRFHALMDEYLPDWRERKRKLQ